MRRTLWDRALGVFGLKRVAAKRTYYGGAEVGRLFNDWNRWVTSATQELRYDLAALRAGSRDLCRNNPIARKFLHEVIQNVVGPQGIKLQATNQLLDGKRDRLNNKRIQDAWLDWGKKGTATIGRNIPWRVVERLALATVARDGEFFARKVPAFDNAHGFALQLLDADLVDETYDVAGGNGANEIRSSVELDPYGAPVAYWVWSVHPAESPTAKRRERVRIPASEIQHLFVRWRVGQVRGEPWLAPIMRTLQLLGGMIEANVVANRAAAAKMGFITNPNGDAAGPDPDEDEESEQYMDAAAGVIERLKPGEGFQGWDPSFPSGNLEPFLKAVIRFAAAGVNVAAVTLSGDLSEANYSSMRHGALSERDAWKMLQTWYAEEFHDEVFGAWLPMARLSGQILLPGRSHEWSARKWRARGWDWVDPARDASAEIMWLALGVTTRGDIAAEAGDDMEDLVARTIEEKELFEENGLEWLPPSALLSTAASFAAAKTQAVLAEDTGNGGDAEEDEDGAEDESAKSRAPGRARIRRSA